MFQRILVSLDGSSRDEHALALATHLAHTTHGSLVLTRIVSTATEFWPAVTAQSPLIGTIIRAHLQDARAYLENLASKPMFDDILTETVVRFGPVVPTLLSTMSAYEIDSLLLCRHKCIAPFYIMQGSATARIVSRTPVPTIVLNEADASAIYYHPVYSALVALTGSAYTEKNTIQTAAHLLASLFPPKQGRLHLTIVTNGEDVEQRGQRFQHRENAFPQVKQHEKNMIEQLQDIWLETLHPEPCVETTFSVVVENDVAQTVAQIAGQRDEAGDQSGDESHPSINFIALSAHACKEATQPLQDGSIEHILQSTQRPLLVIPAREMVAPL